MDQLSRLLARLNWRQRITILAVVALVGGGLFGLVRWNRERDFRPLYTGLAAEDAGAVVARLREANVEYRVADGGILLVPSAKVAEVRLQMAAAGLPRSGRMGFELFDRNNFGATDFTEQVNYHRALEGEIERSINSLAEVEAARVHLTFARDSVFLESRQPAKASVLVRLRPGAKLSPQNVSAISYLVASAVQGLEPESVSILDMRGNLLNRPRKTGGQDGGEPSDAILEFRQQVEKDLLAKITSTIEPLLGPDKFRAGIYAECDLTSGEQSEELFDPAHSVMTSSQRTEDVSGAASAGGAPGTASNLPRPTSRPGSGNAGVSRRTENITYQASRTVRRVRMPQGAVKRLSIGVLVDHSVRWEGSGAKARRIVEPPSPEKLKVIRDLVAAATGFSAQRGDQLVVESLPFESTLSWEPPAAAPAAPAPAPGLPAWLQKLLGDKNTVVLVAAGAGAALLVVLAAAVLILRRGKEKKQQQAAVAVQPALPPSGEQADKGQPPPAQLDAEGLQKQMEAQLAEQVALKERLTTEALNSLKLPSVMTKKTEVLTKHISEEVKKDPAAVAQIVRTWLYERES